MRCNEFSTIRRHFAKMLLGAAIVFPVQAQVDTGLRAEPSRAGAPLPGLTAAELAFFNAGREAFEDVGSVQGTIPNTEEGLGPRFNLDSCAGCHAQPAIGGTSPAVNPQVAVANKAGARNFIPPFISLNGPVREARFKRRPDGRPDGGVKQLFTIRGRFDAGNCNIQQPDFAAALAQRNVTFRIPTPVFGAGLIEAIPDSTILNNKNSDTFAKSRLGISGKENRNGNDGTVTRFGWKAQNKSLVIFSGEAYNVEQGVTNELFPDETDQTPGCLFNPTPEDATDPLATHIEDTHADAALFAIFMRFLAPPAPSPANNSINNGRGTFQAIGCALCHTPAMRTGNHAVAALRFQVANLYSDLLLHDMGVELADDIEQGLATGREFRTAPLWGLGQRIFFLHDGRTTNLIEAIRAHQSQGSEANEGISRFQSLSNSQRQDLIAFLRSL